MLFRLGVKCCGCVVHTRCTEFQSQPVREPERLCRLMKAGVIESKSVGAVGPQTRTADEYASVISSQTFIICWSCQLSGLSSERVGRGGGDGAERGKARP